MSAPNATTIIDTLTLGDTKPRMIRIQHRTTHGGIAKNNLQDQGTPKTRMEMRKEDIADVVHMILVLRRVESPETETGHVSA